MMTRRTLVQSLLLAPCVIGGASEGEATPMDRQPLGPIPTSGMAPRVHDGVEVPGYRFTPRQKTTPWKAQWIGLTEKHPVLLFRREFTLESVPKTAMTYLSADKAYRVWVNGQLASRGPADIGMDYHRVQTGKWFYDVRDLKPFLRRGVNVIAVEVFAVSLTGWEGTREQGGFLCEIEGILATDQTWRVRPATHWRTQNGYWLYDGAQEPHDWHLPGGDVSAWQPATILTDRWQPLVASEVPPRMEALYPAQQIERASASVTVPAKSHFPLTFATDGTVAVRYDRVLPAFIGVRLRGGKGGTLFIEPNEPNAPGYHRRAAIALSGDAQTVELPFLDSFSVINLRTEGITTPLVVETVQANFASLPVAYRGEFTCSDPALTRLWHVCRWATQICLQTHHLDSPHHQEPISDPGDYLIESLSNYYAFFQPWLTRQDLRKYAWIMGQCHNQVFHTSYSLLWLQMLLDYYDYTGDVALVRELATSVHSLLDTFAGYRGKNGLLCEAPNYMFLDWVDIAGFPGHHPPAVIGQGYMTAFFYHALANGIRVAQVTGDTERTARYTRLREEINGAFERELWVEAKGQYRDGKPFQSSVKPGQWLPEDKDIETFTAHVNILAVLYDLAPKERQAAVLEKAITGPNFTCQPYFMHFVFDALAHAGLFEKYAPAQMARWKINEDTQSVLEMWNTGDLSHAWGASPLYQMSGRILGVRPAAPGYGRITIAPLPCGLVAASGTVPIPQGDVRVSWTNGEKFQMSIELPRGTLADVLLPNGTSTTIGPGRHHVG